MLKILFDIIFPLVLLGLLIIIFIIGISKKYPKQEFISLDEFIKDWLGDHGQAHKLEEQFAQMKKDPAGKIYMPITYHGAKLFIKWGLTPNMVSFINLILSFLIFYGVIIASRGHTLDLFSDQLGYGSLFFALAALVLITGVIDGIDGSIARLLDIKSKSGGWLDNVIDRVSDTLMLVCLVPTNLVVLSNGYSFAWMVWTNILLIFIYEYMRARHEGLGLHETKPFIGERITRILLITTFFALYGTSSLAVLLTHLINPDATEIWSVSHEWIINWTMLIYQISLLGIMALSVILFARYIWKNLKRLDKGE
ncbi:MAG: CDP-alcohol phosphatidyltransferase family protein [Candidatus Hodarchaeota archaeon]